MTISNTSRGLRPGVCLSTNRPANPFDGQVIYETDTDLVKAFNGTDFVTVGPAPAAGLVVVKAETAFSAVANVTANGVFTSAFTNYVLFVQASSSANVGILFQLAVGGVATTSNYNSQKVEAISTTVTGARVTAQSSVPIGSRSDTGSQTQSYQFYIFQPQLAAVTSFTSVNQGNNGAGFNEPYVAVMGANQTGLTAFDGLKLLVASGTMTGFFTLYGYAKTV